MNRELKKHIVVVEIRDGLGKGPDGLRKDTVAILKSIESRGWSGEAVLYSDERRDEVYNYIKDRADAFIPRVMPGYLPDFRPLYDMLQELHDNGVTGFAPPSTILAYGKKTVLEKLIHLPFSAEGMNVYRDKESFFNGFPGSLERSGRVLKRNYNAEGKGVWKVFLDDPAADGRVTADSMIECTQAVDLKVQRMRLGEFMDSCIKYLDEPHGGLVDMPFYKRIKEGEIRILMLRSTPVFVIFKKPAGGEEAFSANLYAGASRKYESVDVCPELVGSLLENLDAIRSAVDCPELPFIWSADFIADDGDERNRYILSEFNSTCVGFTPYLDFSENVADAVISELSARERS